MEPGVCLRAGDEIRLELGIKHLISAAGYWQCPWVSAYIGDNLSILDVDRVNLRPSLGHKIGISELASAASLLSLSGFINRRHRPF